MALTRTFDEIVLCRAKSSKTFRNGLFEDAINELINGDFKVAKLLLRHYVNAAIGFDCLAQESKLHNKSIQRMLSAEGNPTTVSLIALLQAISKIEGLRIQAKVKK